MSTADAYRRRAELHRLTDLAGIATAVRDLSATGLRPFDISAALGVSVPVVLETLAHKPPSPPSPAADAPLRVRIPAAGGGGRSFPIDSPQRKSP